MRGTFTAKHARVAAQPNDRIVASGEHRHVTHDKTNPGLSRCNRKLYFNPISVLTNYLAHNVGDPQRVSMYVIVDIPNKIYAGITRCWGTS